MAHAHVASDASADGCSAEALSAAIALQSREKKAAANSTAGARSSGSSQSFLAPSVRTLHLEPTVGGQHALSPPVSSIPVVEALCGQSAAVWEPASRYLKVVCSP